MVQHHSNGTVVYINEMHTAGGDWQWSSSASERLTADKQQSYTTSLASDLPYIRVYMPAAGRPPHTKRMV